jgi:hypothetical protein
MLPPLSIQYFHETTTRYDVGRVDLSFSALSKAARRGEDGEP